MKYILAAALSLLAGQAVFAQNDTTSTNATQVSDIFIVNPVASTIWTAGDSVEIDWTGGNDTVVPIYLDKGPATGQVMIATISANVSSSSGSFSWTVPANLTAGDDYSIQIGDSPLWSFSHPFIIIAPGGNASTFTTAPTSSSLPSSTMISTTTTPNITTSSVPTNATSLNSTASTSTSPTAKSGAAHNIVAGCAFVVVPALLALML